MGNRTDLGCGNRAAWKQRAISLGIGGQRVEDLNRIPLSGLRGERLGEISGALRCRGDRSGAARAWIDGVGPVVREEEEGPLFSVVDLGQPHRAAERSTRLIEM